MPTNCLIPFKISSIDSLGQGVSKVSDKITFIPKTDIDDEGIAEIISERKGVLFAKVKSFKEESPRKIPHVCEHYLNCSGCHFLHIDYENEVKYKKNSLDKLFHRLPHPEIKTLKSPDRLHYRNRVQLHYDLKQNRLGYFEEKSHQIISVPHCQIAHPLVQEKLVWLYENWHSLIPKNSPKGHVEIYLKNNSVQLSWNKPYAEGGFTQVFDKMNQELKSILSSWINQIGVSNVLDLFAGAGNMSENLESSNRFCIDIYPHHNMGVDFISQNLYDKDALKKISKLLREKKFNPDFLLLDPPRSGLKNLKDWTTTFAPDYLAYVSCDPHTLVRDIATLDNFKIVEIFLIDFFPSTYHFETMVFLQRET